MLVCVLSSAYPVAASDDASHDKLQTTLRWGRSVPGSRPESITLGLTELFNSRTRALNFSKRNLTSLLEEAFPRKFGRLFPFRSVAPIPAELFFENFAPIGFLIGELNTRVPPILSETKTADWLELKSNRPIELLREVSPRATLNQGLRSLALQSPWSADVFSALWEEKFEAAAQIIEHGSLHCKNAMPIVGAVTGKNATGKQQPPSHFQCSRPYNVSPREVGIPRQLPRKIGPVATAPQQTESAILPAPPACLPAGRIGMQTLELIGDEKAGHCFLWRSSLDERFQQRPMTSKLICLNARYKSFQKTRFNNIVAIIPSNRTDQINIIEAEDGVLSSHNLNLSTLSVRKNEISASSGQNIRNSSFPRNRSGLYVCKNPASIVANQSPFTNPTTSAAQLEWIYLDDSLYAGLRQGRPETDVALRIREIREGVIDAEQLSWSQLKYDHPSIVAEPGFSCVANSAIDANCALRVLQTSMQISEELLNGSFSTEQVDPQIQFSVVSLVGQALDKVAVNFSDWALTEETQALLTFYTQTAKSLASRPDVGSAGELSIRPAKPKTINTKYLDISRESQDYLAIRNKIFSTGDFWATLKQKSL